jgi:DNA-binding winged helix-turn-helix (wHTH) protein
MKNPKGLPKRAGKIQATLPVNRVYNFGPFCLNQTEQQLLREGTRVRLAPKAFDVLFVLIQNRGCLVTKERLLEEVWPDAFVEEANLSVNIASLRKALDEGETECQYIETIPKRGYRFVAPVTALSYEGLDVASDPKQREVLKSVAVLPFKNEGCGFAGEYLSAGLMESITNRLSSLHDLRVMARHTVYSCHQFNVDPREVGHKLGVSSVLAGRILGLGDELIIRTELVDVMKGWQLWGEQYQTKTSDILMVQHELATEISEKLKIRLTVERAGLVATSMDHPL